MSTVASTSLPRLALPIEPLLVLATGLTAFLLYSNIPTILDKYHGLPSVVVYITPAAFLGIALYYILVRLEPVRISGATPGITLYVGAGTIGTLLAFHPHFAAEGLTEVVIEGVVLFYAVLNCVRTERALRYVIYGIVIAAAFMAAVVTHQFSSQAFTDDYGGFGQLGSLLDADSAETGSRLAGAIGEVNRFAQVLAVALSMALAFALQSKIIWLRAAGAACATLILVGCVLTFSRGVLVGLFGVVCVVLLLRMISLRAIVLGALIASAALVAQPQARERLATIVELPAKLATLDMRSLDGAIRGRFTSMATSFMVFTENPFVGAGPGGTLVFYLHNSRWVGGKVRSYPRESHSVVAQLLGDFGAIGTAGFFWAIGAVMLGCYQSFRATRVTKPETAALCLAMLLGLVAYLGTALFLHMAYIRYFWMVLGVGAAVPFLISIRPEDHEPKSDDGTG